MALEVRRRLFKILMRFGAIILTRFPFWNCFSMLMLFAERADQRSNSVLFLLSNKTGVFHSKVRMYSRTIAVIGGFLILASGAGEVYRQKPRTRSLQSTGQVFLGINLICVAYSLQHSQEDRLAYLNHIIGGEITLQLLFVLYAVLALSFLSGYCVRTAAQILSVLMPLVVLFIDSNVGYWHHSCRIEFWNQMKLLGQNVGVFGAAIILATDC
ncbi:transmembrane protein 101 [Rhincodon typus]|uniref:transmembrane protein 101 n=1 Tax=Rhincodon typus TaxID=259920 RepID=UPI0020306C03|nr:transmembrane protein 101 [Rhincodon typus]